MTELEDLVAAFIDAACVPRDAAHDSGGLEEATKILDHHPHVARSNVHTAAILGDEEGVRGFLMKDPAQANSVGGPRGWDPLTHLCFSRYLLLDATRRDAFVRTARALLDAGASARAGWYETIDHPRPRHVFESALYGAAAIARHPELTRLLLERGADPNDEETPYHVPETYDLTILRILLDSRRVNATSLAWMLLRKTDWHDLEGVLLLLEHGADPNLMTRFGGNALHHAIRRDNALEIILALLEAGADAALPSAQDGRSAAAMAAHRGRADVLRMLVERGTFAPLHGVDLLIAACAMDKGEAIERLRASHPEHAQELVQRGGALLAEFAGNGNVAGMRRLLECGVSPSELYDGDGYFDIAGHSTALHVAAWRARPEVVKELIARGTPVNAKDDKGRTALALAVKACVDSYWSSRRSPESVRALLEAGASLERIDWPCGYDEVDRLLAAYRARAGLG